MTTLAELKVQGIERLMEQAKSLGGMGFDDEFITVNLGDIHRAFEEAEVKFDLLERGIKYTDPTITPPEDELQPGQMWVWRPSAEPPHYEAMDGVTFNADVPRPR